MEARTTRQRPRSMIWVSNVANSALRRQHQPSDGRRKPTYYGWGDIGGPGEMSDSYEDLPVLPYVSEFEPKRTLPEEKVEWACEDAHTEIDVDADVRSLMSEKTLPVAAVAVVERRGSASSEDTLTESQSIVSTSTEKPKRRPSYRAVTEQLRESARKHAARLLQKKNPRSEGTDEIYEKLSNNPRSPTRQRWTA